MRSSFFRSAKKFLSSYRSVKEINLSSHFVPLLSLIEFKKKFQLWFSLSAKKIAKNLSNFWIWIWKNWNFWIYIQILYLVQKKDIYPYPISSIWIYQGFFFGVYEKTQGDKNSNSRKIDQKLKDLFPENSRNRKFSGKL